MLYIMLYIVPVIFSAKRVGNIYFTVNTHILY